MKFEEAVDGDVALIEAQDIRRSFGVIQALKGVSLSFRAGEVHGLVGANGAGKSTFLNVLSGAVQRSSGTIRMNGSEVAIDTPRDADALGLSFIHQELALIPNFSAVENLTLSMRSRLGITNRRLHARLARAAADRVGATFSLSRPVRELSAAQRGMVAIAQALVGDAKFIAMDEPTAALSHVECDRLFEVIKDLARDGVAIAYVSHRLDEVEDLSDRITVFKDGAVTARLRRGEYRRQDLILGITGVSTLEPRQAPPKVEADAAVVLRVDHLSDGERVRDVSLSVRRGEIVGLAGVVGAGRSETLELIYGASRPRAGQMTLEGKPYGPRSVREATATGVALVPEERRSQGLVMGDSVRSNITLGNWKAMRPLRGLGAISDRKSAEVARAMVSQLGIKALDPEVAVGTLSGGNQQKVVLARWVSRGSKVLLLDEPTRGVDIGAREQIWQTVEDLVAAGNSVIIVSSELTELAICHRVVVVVEGTSVCELAGPGVSEDQMLQEIYSYQPRKAP